jgi:hypothetical protein
VIEDVCGVWETSTLEVPTFFGLAVATRRFGFGSSTLGFDLLRAFDFLGRPLANE